MTERQWFYSSGGRYGGQWKFAYLVRSTKTQYILQSEDSGGEFRVLISSLKEIGRDAWWHQCSEEKRQELIQANETNAARDAERARAQQVTMEQKKSDVRLANPNITYSPLFNGAEIEGQKMFSARLVQRSGNPVHLVFTVKGTTRLDMDLEAGRPVVVAGVEVAPAFLCLRSYGLQRGNIFRAKTIEEALEDIAYYLFDY